jgi:hypothetical protein
LRQRALLQFGNRSVSPLRTILIGLLAVAGLACRYPAPEPEDGGRDGASESDCVEPCLEDDGADVADGGP